MFHPTVRHALGFAVALVSLHTGCIDHHPQADLTYQPSEAVLARGTAMAPIKPNFVPGRARFAVAPELPAGLRLDPQTGIITGTPAVTAARTTFRITAGRHAANLILTVAEPAPAPGQEPGPAPDPSPAPAPSPTPDAGPVPLPSHDQVPGAGPLPSPTPGPGPVPATDPRPAPAPRPDRRPEGGPAPSPAPGPRPAPATGPDRRPGDGPAPSPAPDPRPVPAPRPDRRPGGGPAPSPAPNPRPAPAPRPDRRPGDGPAPSPAPDPRPAPAPRPDRRPDDGPAPSPAPDPRPAPAPRRDPAADPDRQPGLAPAPSSTPDPRPATPQPPERNPRPADPAPSPTGIVDRNATPPAKRPSGPEGSDQLPTPAAQGPSRPEILAIVPAARPAERKRPLAAPSPDARIAPSGQHLPSWLEVARAGHLAGYRLVLHPDLPGRARAWDAAGQFLGGGSGRGWLARTRPAVMDIASPAGSDRTTVRSAEPAADLELVLLLQMNHDGRAGGLDLVPPGSAVRGLTSERLDAIIRLRVEDGATVLGQAQTLAAVQRAASALASDLLARLRAAGYGPLGDPDREGPLALVQGPVPTLVLDVVLRARPVAPGLAGDGAAALAQDGAPALLLDVRVRPLVLALDPTGRLVPSRPGTRLAHLQPSRLLGWPVAGGVAPAADPQAPATALVAAGSPVLGYTIPVEPSEQEDMPLESQRSLRPAPGDAKAAPSEPRPLALPWSGPDGPGHREAGGFSLASAPRALVNYLATLLSYLDEVPSLELDQSFPEIGTDPWGSAEDGSSGGDRPFQAGRQLLLPDAAPTAQEGSAPQAPGRNPGPAEPAPAPALATNQIAPPAAAQPGPEVLAIVPAARPAEGKRARTTPSGRHHRSWLEVARAAHLEGCRMVLSPHLPNRAEPWSAIAGPSMRGDGEGGWVVRTRPAGTGIASAAGVGRITVRPARPAPGLDTVLLLQLKHGGRAGSLDLVPSGSAVQGPSPAERLDVVIRLRVRNGAADLAQAPSLATLQRAVAPLFSDLLDRLRAAGYGPAGDPDRGGPLVLAQDPVPALVLDVVVQLRPSAPGLAGDRAPGLGDDAEPALLLDVRVQSRMLELDPTGRLAPGPSGAGLAHLQPSRLLGWPVAPEAAPARNPLALARVVPMAPLLAYTVPAVPVESKRSGRPAPGDAQATLPPQRPLAIARPDGIDPREAGGLGLAPVPGAEAGWLTTLLWSLDRMPHLDLDGAFPPVGPDPWGSMGDGDSDGGSLFQARLHRPLLAGPRPGGGLTPAPALRAAAATPGVPALEAPAGAGTGIPVPAPAAPHTESKRPRTPAFREAQATSPGQSEGSLSQPGGTGSPAAAGLGLDSSTRRAAPPSMPPGPSGLQAENPLVEFNRMARLRWDQPAGEWKSLVLGSDRDPDGERWVGDKDGGTGCLVQPRHRTTYTLSVSPDAGAGAPGAQTESKRPAGSKAVAAPTAVVAARGVDQLAGDFGGPGHADGFIQRGPEAMPTSQAARFLLPKGMAQDDKGRIYICDVLGNTIRMIDGKLVSTLAGDPHMPAGLADARGGKARFHGPHGLAVQPDGGAVYVADTSNHAVRRVLADGHVETLAGGSGAGRNDGKGLKARFNRPTAVALSLDGNALYVADSANGLVRRIALAGDRRVTTLPVTGLKVPAGMVVRADASGAERLYVSDRGRHVILGIPTAAPASWAVLAGTPDREGFKSGKGAGAAFNEPQALALTAGGDLLVADTRNVAIRQVILQGEEAGTVSNLPFPETRIGEGAPRTIGGILEQGGGRLLVADPGQGLIWCAEADGLRPFAGSLAARADHVDGTSEKARFARPNDILVTRRGGILVADTGNGRIRRVLPDGQVVTLPILDPKYPVEPRFLTDDGAGGAYFTSTREDTVEHLDRNGRLRRVAILPRLAGDAGEAEAGKSPAASRSGFAQGIAWDGRNTLYVAHGHGILRIGKGRMGVLAGNPDQPGNSDGDGRGAGFDTPIGLAWRDGHLYVADSGNHAIRQVSPEGRVTTVAGQLGQARSLDLGYADSQLLRLPRSLAFSPDGKLLYVTENQVAGIRRITLADRSTRPLTAATHLTTEAGPLPLSYRVTLGQLGRLGLCIGIACDEWGDVLALTRPTRAASGGVVQVTSPEVEPKHY